MDTISVGGLILRGKTVMGRHWQGGVSGAYRNDDGYTYAGDVDVGSGAANGRGGAWSRSSHPSSQGARPAGMILALGWGVL